MGASTAATATSSKSHNTCCSRTRPACEAHRKTGNGNGKMAVLTTKSMLEVEKGRSTRRTPTEPESSGHITMVGGCTGDGQIAPAAFVVTGGQLAPARRAPLERSLPTDFPLINGNKQSKAIISSSPKGGVISDNILEVMQAMFKIVRPDHSKTKPIVWFTDWGPGRMCEALLSWCRENGVIHIGYLPMCTSLMQLPDTHLFGPFKSLQSTLLAALKRDVGGRALTDAEQLTIACRAMMQICTKERALAGLHAIGMRPIDMAMALVNPAVKDGDVLLAFVNKDAAQHRLRLCQTPASTPPLTRAINEAKSKGTHGEVSPEDYVCPAGGSYVNRTPERKRRVVSVISSTTSGKTRLGPSRSFADGQADAGELALVQDRLVARLNKMRVLEAAQLEPRRQLLVLEHKQLVASATAAFDAAQFAARAEKNKAVAEANAALELSLEKIGQTSTTLESIEASVTKVDLTQGLGEARKLLATFGEVMGDLEHADVDPAGLAVGASEVSVHERPDVALDVNAAATVSTAPLVQVMQQAENSARRRSIGEDDNNTANKRQKLNKKDGKVKMVTGSLLYATGEVSATSKNYVAIVTAYEAGKATGAAQTVDKAAAKLVINGALPARIAAAADKISARVKAGGKVLVGDCAAYVADSMKFAKATGNKPAIKVFAELKKIKGAGLVAAVTERVEPGGQVTGGGAIAI